MSQRFDDNNRRSVFNRLGKRRNTIPSNHDDDFGHAARTPYPSNDRHYTRSFRTEHYTNDQSSDYSHAHNNGTYDHQDSRPYYPGNLIITASAQGGDRFVFNGSSSDQQVLTAPYYPTEEQQPVVWTESQYPGQPITPIQLNPSFTNDIPLPTTTGYFNPPLSPVTSSPPPARRDTYIPDYSRLRQPKKPRKNEPPPPEQPKKRRAATPTPSTPPPSLSPKAGVTKPVTQEEHCSSGESVISMDLDSDNLMLPDWGEDNDNEAKLQAIARKKRDQLEAEEEQRRLRLQQERQLQEKKQRQKEEEERKRKEQEEKRKEEELRQARWERFLRMEREEEERKKREEEERKKREEAERKQREEAERKQREAERRQREEAERKQREVMERKQREEMERKRREEAERKQREEAERKQREEMERKLREEMERRQLEEERRRKVQEARERIERERERERLEKERQRAEEARLKREREEADRKRRELERQEAERKRREQEQEAERRKQESERRRREREERHRAEKERQEAERKQQEREQQAAAQRQQREEERQKQLEDERRRQEEAQLQQKQEEERKKLEEQIQQEQHAQQATAEVPVKQESVVDAQQERDDNEALPPGWEIHYSRSTSKSYFYNVTTGESTWERPRMESVQHPQPPQGAIAPETTPDPTFTQDSNTILPVQVKAEPLSHDADAQPSTQLESIEPAIATAISSTNAEFSTPLGGEKASDLSSRTVPSNNMPAIAESRDPRIQAMKKIERDKKEAESQLPVKLSLIQHRPYPRVPRPSDPNKSTNGYRYPPLEHRPKQGKEGTPFRIGKKDSYVPSYRPSTSAVSRRRDQ